ncbi:hypothetical protein [Sciscionella sediminilitoris]|uniref:hypothetical protein n=1 Tax=Sciscionella sediminilitoris TaxID=1445613 RepID=UPI00056771E7|nr:hypothetical protein [Sciscionella sp. SE31]
MASAESAPAVPRTVRLAGVLVAVEGLAGIAFIVGVLAGGAQSITNRLAEAGYFALLSAGVIAVAVGLLRGARWARTPAVVLQILLVGVAYYALNGASRPEIAFPVVAFAIAVIVLLFVRVSREWAWGTPNQGTSNQDSREDEQDS